MKVKHHKQPVKVTFTRVIGGIRYEVDGRVLCRRDGNFIENFGEAPVSDLLWVGTIGDKAAVAAFGDEPVGTRIERMVVLSELGYDKCDRLVVKEGSDESEI